VKYVQESDLMPLREMLSRYKRASSRGLAACEEIEVAAVWRMKKVDEMRV
jgi:hypothetical protein